MNVVTDTPALSRVCAQLSQCESVAVDTEFLRERTYWPQLCLIQLASGGLSVAVDVLKPDVNLRPFADLMANPNVMKVFHAARQDVEIIFRRCQVMPKPLFDTQVAGMVCGFGDAVGFETLVRKVLGHRLNKAEQYTDWSKRPLRDAQLRYALDDVIYLDAVYPKIRKELGDRKRAHWVREEMNALVNPEDYRFDPADAWKRMRKKIRSRIHLALWMELAAWREATAQRRDVPRRYVMRDEAMQEIVKHQPTSIEDLSRLRALRSSTLRKDDHGAVIACVQRARARDLSELPHVESALVLPESERSLADFLRLLLNLLSERAGVAARLIASRDDLHAIAHEDAPMVPAMRGWRREVFGGAALEFKRGRLGLFMGKKGPELKSVENQS